jgi:hypothetical protein
MKVTYWVSALLELFRRINRSNSSLARGAYGPGLMNRCNEPSSSTATRRICHETECEPTLPTRFLRSRVPSFIARRKPKHPTR